MSEGLLSIDDTQAANLVRAIEQPFDAQNPDHVEACNRLWQAAWPEIPFAGLVHGGWTRLGFPSGDLVKELTSIASVHHLLKLATHAPALFASALEADCPLLAASSAVCLLLREFLRLNTPGSVPGPIGGSPPPGRGSPHGRRVATDETRHRFLSWDESRRAWFGGRHSPRTHFTSRSVRLQRMRPPPCSCAAQ